VLTNLLPKVQVICCYSCKEKARFSKTDTPKFQFFVNERLRANKSSGQARNEQPNPLSFLVFDFYYLLFPIYSLLPVAKRLDSRLKNFWNDEG
jgi:hypothetical protein